MKRSARSARVFTPHNSQRERLRRKRVRGEMLVWRIETDLVRRGKKDELAKFRAALQELMMTEAEFLRRRYGSRDLTVRHIINASRPREEDVRAIILDRPLPTRWTDYPRNPFFDENERQETRYLASEKGQEELREKERRRRQDEAHVARVKARGLR